MVSYILYLFVCNKVVPAPIQISHTFRESLKYIADTSGKNIDFWTKLLNGDDSTSGNDAYGSCKYLINGNKYLLLEAPIEYCDKFINETNNDDLETICKHSIFTLILIKTNNNGTFKDQLAEACDECMMSFNQKLFDNNSGKNSKKNA